MEGQAVYGRGGGGAEAFLRGVGDHNHFQERTNCPPCQNVCCLKSIIKGQLSEHLQWRYPTWKCAVAGGRGIPYHKCWTIYLSLSCITFPCHSVFSASPD